MERQDSDLPSSISNLFSPLRWHLPAIVAADDAGVLWRALGGRAGNTTVDGKIKGREVRLISVVVFQGVIERNREVRRIPAPRDFVGSSDNSNI